MPPQPPRPAVRAENVPAAARPGNENVAMAGTFFYSHILKHPNIYKAWFLVACILVFSFMQEEI